jgi:hypothetical protein
MRCSRNYLCLFVGHGRNFSRSLPCLLIVLSFSFAGITEVTTKAYTADPIIVVSSLFCISLFSSFLARHCCCLCESSVPPHSAHCWLSFVLYCRTIYSFVNALSSCCCVWHSTKYYICDSLFFCCLSRCMSLSPLLFLLPSSGMLDFAYHLVFDDVRGLCFISCLLLILRFVHCCLVSCSVGWLLRAILWLAFTLWHLLFVCSKQDDNTPIQNEFLSVLNQIKITFY